MLPGGSFEGPVRRVPNPRKWTESGHSLFPFAIDWNHERVAGPPRKVWVSWHLRRGGDRDPRVHTQSSRADCGRRAANALCAPATVALRCVLFHPQGEREALNAARARLGVSMAAVARTVRSL